MTEQANTSVDKSRDDAISDECWSGQVREAHHSEGVSWLHLYLTYRIMFIT
jgi:hypothetical protein